MARIVRVGLKAAAAFALVPMLMVFSGGASARSVSGQVGHSPPSVKVTAAPKAPGLGQSVLLGEKVSGGTSPFSYGWTLTTPAGSTALLSSPSAAAPTFTPDVAGSYLAALTVTDAHGLSSPAALLVVSVRASLGTHSRVSPHLARSHSLRP